MPPIHNYLIMLIGLFIAQTTGKVSIIEGIAAVLIGLFISLILAKTSIIGCTTVILIEQG